MSTPDPVAALRTFIAAKEKAGKYKEPSVYVTRDYTNSADALLEHVKRLEAALVEFAEAARCYYDSGERQSRYYDAENTVLALGREIAGRKP